MTSLSDRGAEKFADIRPTGYRNNWSVVIWRWGGHINGSAQPFKVLEQWYADEITLRVQVEENYPGIAYAPEPEYLNGMLLP